MNKFSISLLILVSLAAPPLRGQPDLLVLQTRDTDDEQNPRFQTGRAGNIRGAELTLKRLPAGPPSSDSPDQEKNLYLPVSLKLDLNRHLTGGEVQLCVFIHLPPFYIEHLVTRDSFIDPGNGQRILLTGEHEFSFILGLDPEKEKKISDFKESGLYQNCFFFSPPEKMAASFSQGRQFNVHSGEVYLFPSSSTIYWHRLPPLKVSTSLTVMRVDNLKMGKIEDFYHDTMTSSWSILTQR